MGNTIAERYLWLNGQLETDPEYLALMERLREKEPAFLAVVEALSSEDRDVVMEYLGVCGELVERMRELCCVMP